MAENWTLATSGSMGGLVPVLQPRSGSFEKKKAPRMRMGGGFCAHSPPRSFSSDRVRPTRQLFHPDRNSEAFVARSMRTKGLVPTLPDGSQPRPQPRVRTQRGKQQQTRPHSAKELAARESHKVSKAVNKLSAEYIDNLQMQIQILEREIEITKLKSSNDMALLRSSWDDGEVKRKHLSHRTEAQGILALDTVQAMQKWLRAFFSRHARDPRVAPHRDSVLAAFRENMVTGADAATLSAQELRDELKIPSLAVRKLLLSEIEAQIAASNMSQRAGTSQGGVVHERENVKLESERGREEGAEAKQQLRSAPDGSVLQEAASDEERRDSQYGASG